MTATAADLAFLPVHELAGAMAAGRLTSAQIVETFLDRVERHESRLHSFTSAPSTAFRSQSRTSSTSKAGSVLPQSV